tara:strand:- start:1195 stop:2106 length:912 start_codon:yes stop_codon:yes gene_type:complete
MTKVDIADLDCIYLSYDEPKKEEFWAKIQNIVPWAKRVDGVEGSDAAHKAAAEASDTERFVLIDGDNMPYPDFFDITLNLEPRHEDCVFRWKAVNAVNGLMYGNGGLSCWTRNFVNNMKTHENSDGADENEVEFCYDPKYLPMNNVYSTTHPNGSAYHSWRAGFREGVKMCLKKGTKPSLVEFNDMVHKSNFDRLSIWHNIGIDVEHGDSCISGARYGTYRTMLTDWDYTEVQDFYHLGEIYSEWKTVDQVNINKLLQTRLGLHISEFTSDQSIFFKKHYANTYTSALPMTLEIDMLRKTEGW